MKIFFVGDPHRGKSVAEKFIRHNLPFMETMRIAAAPDGEGDWTEACYEGNGELAAQLRRKGKFSPEFVEWACNAIRNCTTRFTLIDLGGVISEENRQMISSACDECGMIVLAASFEEAQKWVDFGKELGCRILAVLISSLTESNEWHQEVDDRLWEFEGLVYNLDRETFTGSATLMAFVEYLQRVIPKIERHTDTEDFYVRTIDYIARSIGKGPEEITIGRGETARKIFGLNWKTEELPVVYQMLKGDASTGRAFLIDGRAPQFLVNNIVHALHPCDVALVDDKVDGGMVWITGWHVTPKGKGSGPIPFDVTSDFLDGTLVECARDALTIIPADELDDVIPPEVAKGKPVFISGKISNWASAQIATAYAHKVPAVYNYQPGTGFICTITHSPDHELGSVIQANPPKPVAQK